MGVEAACGSVAGAARAGCTPVMTSPAPGIAPGALRVGAGKKLETVGDAGRGRVATGRAATVGVNGAEIVTLGVSVACPVKVAVMVELPTGVSLVGVRVRVTVTVPPAVSVAVGV